MRAAVAGDQDAFAQLYRANYGKVISVLNRWTRNREDAEDLASETFLQAFEKLGSFRGTSRFSTWIYRMAKNNFLMMRRRQKSAVGLAMVNAVSLDASNGDLNGDFAAFKDTIAYVDHRQRSVELCELPERIGRLKPTYQRALVLNIVYGVDHSELARLQRISVSGIKTQFFRARAAARLVLADFKCS